MDILKQVKFFAEHFPERIGIRSSDCSVTYKQLDEESSQLASWMNNEEKEDKSPVVVYGHKSAYMVVCFLACVKSGRAYCPVDISMPDARINEILEIVNPSFLLCVEDFQVDRKNVISKERIKEVSREKSDILNLSPLKQEDVFYIIFTSGSTGAPKGVEISRSALEHFLDWSVHLGTSVEEKLGKVFLNQAPFSFDLAVMDLYTSLACGGTLCTMEKEVQMDYSRLIAFLEQAGIHIWVSTPSFADVCLSDKKFSEQLMPDVEVFLFCGETLTNNTADQLLERFPRAKVINTYGPTESTVAVTEVNVTRELIQSPGPLPIGKVKEGSWLQIVKEDGSIAGEGERGEILIYGNTVSKGYFKQPELTERAFITVEEQGKVHRGYKTGDLGYLKEGQLHYCGRIDLQIKLHGYRIEIEDIENNFVKLPEVDQAVVIPTMKDGKVKSLTAFLACRKKIEDSFQHSKRIKAMLKGRIPEYMIPKKIVFLDKIPMTNNGKVDRKRLKEQQI